MNCQSMSSKIFKRSDFDRIKNEGFTFKLPEETIELIKKISKNVGAPEYIKTPHFEKKGTFGTKLRIHTKEIICDTEWNLVRNFKATTLEKKEGIALSIDKIRKHLNKMTDKTYDKLYEQIVQEIELIGCDSLENEDICKELKRIGDSIFEIASSNGFYSKMYAKLYKELMLKYDFMKTIFNEHLNSDVSIFKNFAYCSPDKDYDTFCKNNKVNEKRRAIGSFYINLMLYDVIPTTKIISMIHEMQTDLISFIKKESHVNIVDEMSELLYILIVHGKSMLKPMKNEWKQFINRIEIVSLMTNKSHPSISNKTIFKHMDMMEAIKK